MEAELYLYVFVLALNIKYESYPDKHKSLHDKHSDRSSCQRYMPHSKTLSLIEVCNRSLWWCLCVVTLLFGFFSWCRGFCHRTESDLFLFLLRTSDISWGKLSWKRNKYYCKTRLVAKKVEANL